MKKRTQILLTNDDGIQSPGLWAAAQALSHIGYVTVAAPRDQATATGRSLPFSSDGSITPNRMFIGDQEWTVYAVGGSPAQVVLHSVLEIMDGYPHLVVSGINYGENVGHSITISGTVGAALEAASLGIPALAVSLQVDDPKNWISHSPEIDFTVAAHFASYFASLVLKHDLPADIDVLKIDIPNDATADTPWRTTHIARHRYYFPVAQRSGRLEDKGHIGVYRKIAPEELDHRSDLYTLLYDRMVSVTPLSLDMTSRVELDDLEKRLRE
ncbi:MAG TPA: 5'/3'-nucleotidase SurE [Levilinea sp.]|nr:5'/3'-nucleotidase SurE [Levilinea sp.]